MQSLKTSEVAPPAGAWIETRGQRNLSISPMVAPPAGAWIETAVTAGKIAANAVSRPPRARGLKQDCRGIWPINNRSRPPRARGLKRIPRVWDFELAAVAPPAGAWIETDRLPLCALCARVAPPAGAWIETSTDWDTLETADLSRPPRARGLKQPSRSPPRPGGWVAPPAGAWIETA